MTLSSVRPANFNAFGAAQRMPLRLITLVFGPNSAGKSSLDDAPTRAPAAPNGGRHWAKPLRW